MWVLSKSTLDKKNYHGPIAKNLIEMSNIKADTYTNHMGMMNSHGNATQVHTGI